MSSLNQVNIIGRLGQDPEVKFMGNGTAVCNLTVATSERWKDKQTGEQKEATEWHRVVIYGKLAEICGEYLRKGSLAFFSGSLKTRKWTDQAGVEKYTTEIVAQDMKMLGGRENGGRAVQWRTAEPAAAPTEQSVTAAAPQQSQQQSQQDFDSDVPF